MQEFHKAVEILEKYEFEFVDVSQVASANIIIKSPEILSHDAKKLSAKYKIVRAKHICDTQIKLAVIELLKSFEETEDLEFVITRLRLLPRQTWRGFKLFPFCPLKSVLIAFCPETEFNRSSSFLSAHAVIAA